MKTTRFLAAALLIAPAAFPAVPEMKFDFGSGKAKSGYTKVAPDAAYSDASGYGFEPKKGEGPTFFTVKVPEEGNYRVTVTLGDEKTETMTTIKAEIRRLMITRVHTDPGKFVTRSFLVNVRNSKIAGGGEVRLKDREKGNEAIAWDDKLQLEFTDTHPGVRSLTIEKDDKVPTIFIAGDSTSTDQPREPFSSWGQSLPVFFKPEIAVANHGESGESLRGFFGEKRVDKVMSVIRPGDYLFIQMGHNDQKDKGEGVGAFTTYKADMKRFVEMAKAKGATVVIVTPMNRLTFGEDGKITNSLGDYPEAGRQAAKEEGIALIDLNAMSKPFYESMGPVESHKAFAGKDTTHHSDYGSYELAKCIVQGIKDNNLPIAKFLYPMPAFDPAHPDPIDKFDIPAEPMPAAIQRPLGN
jgi:lysophospholipase L1-like esterase